MVQHDGRRVGRRAGDRSHGEPDTVCPKHARLLHTPAMVDAFRSPLAPDALAGQVAIVTGGGTGIGAATARAVVAAGASVAICGRRPEPLAVVAESLGERCLARPCDVREPEQVAGFLDAVADRFERVDLLVHSAGGQFAAPLEQTPLKGMRAVHRLNVDAVWDLHPAGRHALDDPEPRRVHRVPGFQPSPGHPLVRALLDGSQRLGDLRRGDRARVVEVRDPGPCASPRDWCRPRALLQYGGQEVIDGFAEQIPMRRAGTPEEVAATIAFLASAGGAYITGHDRRGRRRRRRLGHGRAPTAARALTGGSAYLGAVLVCWQRPEGFRLKGGPMYGTVAKMRVKADNVDAVRKVMAAQMEGDKPAGTSSHTSCWRTTATRSGCS